MMSQISIIKSTFQGLQQLFFIYWAIGIQPTLPRNRNVRSERRSDERHPRRRRRRARKNETVSLPPPFFLSSAPAAVSRTLGRFSPTKKKKKKRSFAHPVMRRNLRKSKDADRFVPSKTGQTGLSADFRRKKEKNPFSRNSSLVAENRRLKSS